MSDQPSLTLIHADHQVTLHPGEQVTFGRATDGATRDEGGGTGETTELRHIGLSANPRLHLLAGRIDVDGAGWVLTNTGRWLHLRVVELDGPNRTELHPGRAVRIPYPRCRIEVTTGDETVGFDAACPWLDRQGVEGADGTGVEVPLAASPTVGGLGLDRSAGYFRALVALCAPRLRDPQSDEVSSVGEIVRVLNTLPQETERVTAKAVERRLAHVRRKLSLAASDPYGGSAAGLELRDAARQLADLVLRTGTVTPADLRLLDPTAVAAAGEPGRSATETSGPG